MAKIKFPSMIHKLRTEKKLTMDQLGKKLGKAKSTISTWENGQRSPKMDEIEKIASFFKVDPMELLFGDNYELSDEIVKKTLVVIEELEIERQKSVYDFAVLHLKKQKEGIEYEENTTDLFTIAEGDTEYIAAKLLETVRKDKIRKN